MYACNVVRASHLRWGQSWGCWGLLSFGSFFGPFRGFCGFWPFSLPFLGSQDVNKSGLTVEARNFLRFYRKARSRNLSKHYILMHHRSWPALTSKTHVSGRTRQILEDGSRETVVPPCLALASASSSSHFVTISKTSSQRWKTILRRCFHFTVIYPRFPKPLIILIFDFLHDFFLFQGTVLVTEADQWKQYWSTFESYASSLNQSCHILAISFRSLPLPSTSDTADIVARYTFMYIKRRDVVIYLLT